MTSLTPRPISSGSLSVEQTPIQSPDETIVYSFDTALFGGTPTTPILISKNLTTNQVVTTVITAGPTIDGDLINFTIANLQSINSYRVDIKFTIGAEVFERYVNIRCVA